jgi:hypothetical protein
LPSVFVGRDELVEGRLKDVSDDGPGMNVAARISL